MRSLSGNAVVVGDRVAPGLAIAVVGATTAMAVNRVVPTVSALTVAVVLGVLVGGALPAAASAGLQWATRRFLRVAVVLLGLQLSMGEVLALGPAMLVSVVVTVLVGFFGTIALGRMLGVSRGLGLLVATGFSICGASAIVAMDSVARTDKDEVAVSVTLVTLYGTTMIAVVPLVGAWRGMPDEVLGMWAGLSVHEVAQVVAAASPAGAAAVAAAVVVKLTRVVLLAPMVAGVGVLQRRADLRSGPPPPVVPIFVVWFLIMVVVRSSGVVPGPVLSAAQVATTGLFAAALFGLASAVRLRSLLTSGRRGLVLGALSTVLVATVSLGALAVAGW